VNLNRSSRAASWNAHVALHFPDQAASASIRRLVIFPSAVHRPADETSAGPYQTVSPASRPIAAPTARLHFNKILRKFARSGIANLRCTSASTFRHSRRNARKPLCMPNLTKSRPTADRIQRHACGPYLASDNGSLHWKTRPACSPNPARDLVFPQGRGGLLSCPISVSFVEGCSKLFIYRFTLLALSVRSRREHSRVQTGEAAIALQLWRIASDC